MGVCLVLGVNVLYEKLWEIRLFYVILILKFIMVIVYNCFKFDIVFNNNIMILLFLIVLMVFVNRFGVIVL